MNNMNTTKKYIIIVEPGTVIEDINSENSIFISEHELYNMVEIFEECSSTSRVEERKRFLSNARRKFPINGMQAVKQ